MQEALKIVLKERTRHKPPNSVLGKGSVKWFHDTKLVPRYQKKRVKFVVEICGLKLVINIEGHRINYYRLM